MITPARLAEISARANAATPGPWHYTDSGGINGVEDDKKLLFWSVPKDFMQDGDGTHATWRDTDFIANARTDIPDLVAEIRRLRGALEEIAEMDAHCAEAMSGAVAKAALEGAK